MKKWMKEEIEVLLKAVREAEEGILQTRPVECFKCHKLGHFQYECPSWEKSANYAEIDE